MPTKPTLNLDGPTYFGEWTVQRIKTDWNREKEAFAFVIAHPLMSKAILTSTHMHEVKAAQECIQLMQRLGIDRLEDSSDDKRV